MTRDLHTSASQLVSYAMCPRKYAFSYVWGVEPEFRSTALVLGSAVHSAVGWYFGEKLAGRPPEKGELRHVVAADILAGTFGENVRWKEATPDSLESDALRLVDLYTDRFGDLPVASVEAPFECDLSDPDTGEVVGRRLKGYFDLVLGDGRVIEIKTTSRGWQATDLDRHLQIGAYAFAWNALHGGPCKVEVHTIVKLKREPRVDVFPVERGEDGTRWWLTAAGAIERAIEARHFPPSPGPLCHECEYARSCAGWTLDKSEHVERRHLPTLDPRLEAAL